MWRDEGEILEFLLPPVSSSPPQSALDEHPKVHAGCWPKGTPAALSLHSALEEVIFKSANPIGVPSPNFLVFSPMFPLLLCFFLLILQLHVYLWGLSPQFPVSASFLLPGT